MGKILAAVFIALCAYAWRFYRFMDVGRSVYNHRPGVCRQVEGPIKGSEDIELIRDEGIAFITSGLLHLQLDKKGIEGKIFLFDFKQKSKQLKAYELLIKGESFDQSNFFPHGLSHWVVNGVIRLYVINHDKQFKHSIEIFDYDPKGPALIHNQSLKHHSFIRPNDLVAVGPDEFIFTNDAISQTETGNMFEFLSGYNGGSVYYWDVKNSNALLTGMGGPNGIAYDAKQNKLFVSEFILKRINAYELDKDKKSASLLSTIDLHSACDNLYLDTDGSVYSGCHPIAHEAAKSFSDLDGKITSPSQVLRIKFDKEYKSAAVSEPYCNDGSEVSGSSSVVLHDNQMLIGTIFMGLLHCEVADLSVL